MGSARAIDVVGLTKDFKGRRAVDNLDMSIPQGRITGFVGPNGAGKTTTIRMLLGLIHPSGGRGEVLGVPIERPAGYLSRVGALIEEPAIYPGLTGRANLESLQKLGGLPTERIGWVLECVGLTSRCMDRAGSYSLGMKQRLAIAGALLPKPELLILDEPTNGLDPAGIREIRGLLRSLADEGTSILISSHLLGEIQAICDQLVMIKSGKSIYQGSVEGLIGAQRTRISVKPSDPRDLSLLAATLDRMELKFERDNGVIAVDADRGRASAINHAAFAAGIVLEELRVEHPSLEDAFFALEVDGAVERPAEVSP